MQKLWSLLKKIPRGKVTTYKILGKKLGLHPRAIGKLLSKNPYPVKIPCHRVVLSSGKLGGYKFGIKRKSYLLKIEGIVIKNGKIDLRKRLHKF